MFAFVASLLLTVVLLLSVVWSGLRARRRLHLTLVGLTLFSLATTIFFAERLGDQYDLSTGEPITTIHLTMAKVTTLAYLLPLGSGFLVVRKKLSLRWHRRLALLVVALTVATLITGCWMLLVSDRLPVPPVG